MLTTILIILGIVLLVAGLVGSFLPVIPGPPLSWLGLLSLYFIEGVPENVLLLVITFGVAVGISVLDYFLPAMGTKKYGGSKYGAWGATIGLILGLIFFPPFGFVIGPFVGAFVAEIIFNKSNTKNALKSAWGSFMGFLVSSFMKFLVCLSFLIIYIYKMIEYRDFIF
ncbi:DUF456 domain-containing protein [Psychroflexus planctonicus]|uniref:Membrane protein n=1 Tax=Psychroflexus planctonicus TaxID=1526575 RepID=A0ABQ1SBI3_9FLAO|nr:DUF456 domain-containing protein [Psychroflexus planctonicus]GGE24530.1 membrane protein [Psychroflexus planctonicus]